MLILAEQIWIVMGCIVCLKTCKGHVHLALVWDSKHNVLVWILVLVEGGSILSLGLYFGSLPVSCRDLGWGLDLRESSFSLVLHLRVD